MTISLIISTNNREKALENLLKRLPQQDTQPDEIIIVVGPDSEKTLEMLQNISLPVKILRCYEHNLSKSRNIGVVAASGEIAVLIDDDALPLNPQWLSLLISGFESDSTVAAIGGSVLIRDSDDYEFDHASSKINEYGQSITLVTLASGELLSTDEYTRVQGCNCAFRISHLKQVGGFDEWYDYYHDETDVVLRLHQAGFKVLFTDEATVRHFSRIDDFSDPRRRRYWLKMARSDAYCAVKNSSNSALWILKILPFKLIRRYYWREVSDMKTHNLISFRVSLLLKSKLLAGWAMGMFRGLLLTRRCPFVS